MLLEENDHYWVMWHSVGHFLKIAHPDIPPILQHFAKGSNFFFFFY